jgi:hypothetical protein
MAVNVFCRTFLVPLFLFLRNDIDIALGLYFLAVRIPATLLFSASLND